MASPDINVYDRRMSFDCGVKICDQLGRITGFLVFFEARVPPGSRAARSSSEPFDSA